MACRTARDRDSSSRRGERGAGGRLFQLMPSLHREASVGQQPQACPPLSSREYQSAVAELFRSRCASIRQNCACGAAQPRTDPGPARRSRPGAIREYEKLIAGSDPESPAIRQDLVDAHYNLQRTAAASDDRAAGA
jgi:hypothetical protein